MSWKLVPDTVLVDIDATSRLVDHLHDTDFCATLFAMFDTAGCEVEEACGISLGHGSDAPEAVGWYGRRADTASRVHTMTTRFFHKDPMFRSLPMGAQVGRSYFSALRPAVIEDDLYRWLCFDDSGFRQRVSVARAEPQGWGIINLFLAREMASEAQLVQLAGLARLAFPFIRRHNGWAQTSVEAPPPPDQAKRLAELLGNRFPTLTQRERHVCAMTVMGRDSATIANILAITRNTVLTYRRRAYERLGVSSASALLAQLV